MPHRTPLAALAAVLALALATAACSSQSGSSGSGSPQRTGATIEVTLTDTGCAPRSITASPGRTTFHVTNKGTAAVTEFEVLQGGRILGEVENVIPGADRSFSLDLAAGSYATKCPGGSSFDAGDIDVTAAAPATTG